MVGEPGNFNVTLVKRPRYVDESKCTGCTTCVENCPVKYPDPFNQEISKNKAIHIYFAQAVPLVTYIDETCTFLREKKCRICESVCGNNAIDFSQMPEKVELNVGAIVLAPGIEPFDARLRGDYGYGRMPNVVTSMDYERLLAASGPYEGEILRPSDRKHPHKIAWIQCVGSRQVIPGGNSYCSAVCCTYTQKQVILTKEHYPEAECVIFHNDIRAYGKDFERYFERAERLPGVRFIRSYVSLGRENRETRNIAIRYATPHDGVKEEEFDLVVLSVGLRPPADYRQLAHKFGIELNPHGFCRTTQGSPIESTRRGVFVIGGFRGPADIPESVYSASAAVARCGELLNHRRGKLTVQRPYPLERDVSQEKPRVGVYVCHCGTNIGRVINVPSAVEYARTLPNVVFAHEQLFSCATNSAKEIADMAKEKGVNRLVIAACSPRTLEGLFRDTLREAGLNQYLLEMVNIREHCSWVHAKDKEEAARKANDLIRMAVARASRLEPLQEFDLPVHKAALVVGGGIAGMTCALSIANQGHQVHLVEKEYDLGGMAQKIYSTLDGMDVQTYLCDLIRKVYQHPLIHVYTSATILEATGYVGNFVTRVKCDRGIREIKHGATVIAIGADLYRPTEYLYGEDERVLTHLELEDLIYKGDERIVDAETAVMIQCVGCRNEERSYCSRVCCNESIKNALALKEKNPQADVYILFRDIRTYGFNEDFYREAAAKDVRFIRFEPPANPKVEAVTDNGKATLRVTVLDATLGKNIEIDADIVALAAAVVPRSDSQEISQLFKVSLGQDGFFKEAHVKLRPVDTGTDGVYLCGMAHYPKHISEVIDQAYAAAGRVLTLLSHDTVVASGSVCTVEERKCMGCGHCVVACTYGAIELRDTRQGKKAVVNPIICKGCGVCNAKCPTGSIQLKHFTDEALIAQIDAAVSAEEADLADQIGVPVGVS